MSRVITFSTKFPATHPKAGQLTYFIEKIWKGYIHECLPKFPDWINVYSQALDISVKDCYDLQPKLHTIRKGKRWKEGDKFCPRAWSAKPYASKQVIIAPEIELKRVADIEISATGHISIDGVSYSCEPVTGHPLAINDGLSNDDFRDWLAPSLPFSGQILIWTAKELPY